MGKLLAEAKAIALAAGREIERVSSDACEAELKADGSPVTRADMAAHELIVCRLEGLRPGYPVVSEEGCAPLSESTSGGSAVYWLVDPLDGTKEFIAGNGEYTVNLALMENDSPVLGVIYAPALDLLYYAAKDAGAWRETGVGRPRRLRRKSCAAPRTAVISRSHPSAATDAFLQRLEVTHLIKRGSSLKMCAVAEGEADIYPRLAPTCFWDTAAGAIIAREAGCRVEDPDGEDLKYDWEKGWKHTGFVVYPP